ncbi:MAG TPA: gas vesicle protein GvpG [Streptosporangiaceae bacterium]|nr:gas vesicle protein GvpG [Streptosporangiaceae bacterium]
MGLITVILTLPFAPVRGVVAVGEIIQRQAEQELYSPQAIRARLEEIDEQRRQGDLTDEEADRLERDVLAQIQQ